jgi:hypothetical protein
MRGSPACAVESVRHRQETRDWLSGVIERHYQFYWEASLHWSKKMKGLAPHPWAIIQPTGKSHTQVDACVCGGGEASSPFPHGGQKSAGRPASCWRRVNYLSGGMRV